MWTSIRSDHAIRPMLVSQWTLNCFHYRSILKRLESRSKDVHTVPSTFLSPSQEQQVYQPQTEAISPTPEEPKVDSNMRDSTIVRSSISKLESEIDSTMKKLHRAKLSQVRRGIECYSSWWLPSNRVKLKVKPINQRPIKTMKKMTIEMIYYAIMVLRLWSKRFCMITEWASLILQCIQELHTCFAFRKKPKTDKRFSIICTTTSTWPFRSIKNPMIFNRCKTFECSLCSLSLLCLDLSLLCPMPLDTSIRWKRVCNCSSRRNTKVTIDASKLRAINTIKSIKNGKKRSKKRRNSSLTKISLPIVTSSRRPFLNYAKHVKTKRRNKPISTTQQHRTHSQPWRAIHLNKKWKSKKRKCGNRRLSRRSCTTYGSVNISISIRMALYKMMLWNSTKDEAKCPIGPPKRSRYSSRNSLNHRRISASFPPSWKTKPRSNASSSTTWRRKRKITRIFFGNKHMRTDEKRNRIPQRRRQR